MCRDSTQAFMEPLLYVHRLSTAWTLLLGDRRKDRTQTLPARNLQTSWGHRTWWDIGRQGCLLDSKNLKGVTVFFVSSYDLQDNALDTVGAHRWVVASPNKESHSINIMKIWWKDREGRNTCGWGKTGGLRSFGATWQFWSQIHPSKMAHWVFPLLVSRDLDWSLERGPSFSISWYLKVKMLVAQSCPTPCNPINCSLPGSSVHGILKGRILKWVAIPFSRGSSQPRDWT